jgi:hypothetical protein
MITDPPSSTSANPGLPGFALFGDQKLHVRPRRPNRGSKLSCRKVPLRRRADLAVDVSRTSLSKGGHVMPTLK